MDLKQIKELMAAMQRAGIKKLSIKETTGYGLELERECEHPPAAAPVTYTYAHPHPQPHPQPHLREHEHSAPPSLTSSSGHSKTEVEGKYVTSPMVGSFYVAASPDDPAFVKVGDRVEEGTVVCIIEAMKVMNEVKAGMSGTIAEVCIDNAHPVEFGTKLFRIV